MTGPTQTNRAFGGLLAIIALAWASSGCVLLKNQSYDLKVGAGTASKLTDIDSHLRASGAEVRFHTRGGRTEVRISGGHEPALEVEKIAHPFTSEFILLRLTGGTKELRAGLYEALGGHVATEDFKGTHHERELLMENGRFKIRCVESRRAPRTHACWTLIGAELVD